MLPCNCGCRTLGNVRMIDNPESVFQPAVDMENQETTEQESNLSDCHVLLADDGPDNRLLVTHFLNKSGAKVEVAENVKIAVDMTLEARENNDPFDIILMDMQMPVMDGYQATGWLRQKGYTGTIVALTAHAMAADREKCLRQVVTTIFPSPLTGRNWSKSSLNIGNPRFCPAAHRNN